MRVIYYILKLAARSVLTIVVMIVISASALTFLQVQSHEPLWNAQAIRGIMPEDIVLGRNIILTWSPDCLMANFEWDGDVTNIDEKTNLGIKYKVYDESNKSDWRSEENENIISDLNNCYKKFKKDIYEFENLKTLVPDYIFESNNATDMIWALKEDNNIKKFSFMTERGIGLIVIVKNTAILMM